MAPVALAVALTVATSTVAVTLGAITLTTAVTAVLTTALTAGAGYLLSKQKALAGITAAVEGPQPAPANFQRAVVTRQAVPPRRFVYGMTRVGGVVIFQDNDNPDLYTMQALSDGEIEGVSAIYIGDQLAPVDGSGDAVAGTTYDGRLSVEYRMGTDAQSASTMLTTAFSATINADFRQLGVATATSRMDWGADSTQHNALWANGIEATYLVCGVKVIDPRTEGTTLDGTETHAYSDNPALCIGHALVNAWDLALDYTDVDWQSVADAANDCDATVTIDGDALPTFTLAGVLQSGAEMATQIDGMLSSCGGAIYFADGKYKLRVDKARPSIWTVTDDDIIELGDFEHEGRAANVPNAAKAQFADQDSAGLQDTTPAYEHAAASGEATREVVIGLHFTPKSYQAQIIAYRELIRAREGRALQLVLTDAGLYLEPFDVITIDSGAADFINGLYQVIQVDLSNPGCIVQLRGYTADTYAAPSGYVQ